MSSAGLAPGRPQKPVSRNPNAISLRFRRAAAKVFDSPVLRAARAFGDEVSRRGFALPPILLLALGLRLIFSFRPLWYDEAFAVLFAEKGLGPMLYGTLTPVNGGAADIHPLLYYVTLGGWMRLFGESIFAVRALSVLFGVATVDVIFLLGRDLFDRRVGLSAALVTALAPFAVQYATEVRMYGLLGLLTVGATWFFVRGWRTPAPVLLPGKARRWWRRWGWWAGFGVLAALAMYTQQLAAFYLAAIGLVPLIARRRRQSLGALLGALIALLLYAPWLAQLPGQLSKVGAYFWIAPPPFARLLLTLQAFMVVGVDIQASLALSALAGALVVVLFLAVQAIMALRRPRRRDRRALLLVLWLAGAPVILMWLVSQVRPVYLERALLPSALMLYLALGWLFARGGMPGLVRSLVALIAGMLAVAGLFGASGWTSFPYADYPGALALITKGWQSGDIIVHQNKLSALPMAYVDRSLPQKFIADSAGSPEDTLALPTQQTLGLLAEACLQSALRGANRVWWVVFGDVNRQADASARADIRAELDWLASHYVLSETARFSGDLEVLLYSSPDAVARAAGECPVTQGQS